MLSVELVYARFVVAVGFAAHVHHAFGADLRPFDEFGQFVQLLAGIACAPFGADRADIFGRIEYAESLTLGGFGNVVERHAEPDIGFVRSVFIHRFVPADPREVPVELFAEDVFEQALCQAFEHIQNVFAFDERHFAVDLRKFRLTVGPQVFVAETAHDLEIAVVTGHHQQLFERLRRLRQRVEFARVHPRRNHEVARAFRRRFDQIGRFYFEKAIFVQVIANFVRHPVTQYQRVFQRVAAQVEETVFHPQFIAAVAVVFDRERRGLRYVEHLQSVDRHFDLAGRDLRVFRGPGDHFPAGLYHVFASQSGGRGAHFVGRMFFDYQLGDAVTVADIDERHGAEISHFLYPAGQRNVLV